MVDRIVINNVLNGVNVESHPHYSQTISTRMHRYNSKIYEICLMEPCDWFFFQDGCHYYKLLCDYRCGVTWRAFFFFLFFFIGYIKLPLLLCTSIQFRSLAHSFLFHSSARCLCLPFIRFAAHVRALFSHSPQFSCWICLVYTSEHLAHKHTHKRTIHLLLFNYRLPFAQLQVHPVVMNSCT